MSLLKSLADQDEIAHYEEALARYLDLELDAERFTALRLRDRVIQLMGVGRSQFAVDKRAFGVTPQLVQVTCAGHTPGSRFAVKPDRNIRLCQLL